MTISLPLLEALVPSALLRAPATAPAAAPAVPAPVPSPAPAPAPAPLFLRRAAALRRTTSRLLYIWQYQKVGKGDVYLPLFSCRLPLGVE
eukprot:CAMPEP_0173294732 /NCGR_PEP_ID=MMETSP1143-20121109/14044_1 /TAXON_ID=483371 /ORGANISM="non described non described, Strain CCMP2298" /LENGTH=89 /DNA_ID=CAMNT_0014234457 /DNA_START=169 /DNA_END=438 /DNA_ORIENTATION=+